MATYPATVPAVNKYPKYGIGMRHCKSYTRQQIDLLRQEARRAREAQVIERKTPPPQFYVKEGSGMRDNQFCEFGQLWRLL